MIKKLKFFIIILIILLAYVVVVEADNYFNGDLSESRAFDPDPNSQESLEKSLLELIDLSGTYHPLMFEHRKQAQILQDKINELQKEIPSILDKMDELGYLDSNGCIEMQTSDDFPVSTCK